MNPAGISNSIRLLKEPIACPQCGSTSRVGRGLCLNCLLQTGLGVEAGNNETLDGVLAEIEVPDADWRLGNYQILEEIGRGGMGVIYRARQRHSRRIVALKRVLSYHADSQETLARFRREAEAAASLDHPNILPIYEVSEGEDGLPFFSMKFAPGGSLLDSAPALRDEPRRSVTLIAKVARAVQYAHVQGILHRDLKPGNILLDGRGEPLVSDFGLAKWLDTTSDVTRTLTIFGTPGYIAPEQARGPAAHLRPAADVYSLGAILFDLFTGRPPFLGEHALAVIQQAAEKPAPKLRTLAPSLDRDLETICARCLERESRARYQSAGELAEDLGRWLEGRPIIARPVLPHVRLYRWSRRNPKLAVTVGLCLLLGAAAIGWQVQDRHLAATVREEELAAHSIAVLPFLDLDHARADDKLGVAIADALQRDLARSGPTRIAPVLRVGSWLAGAGTVQDVKEANRNSKARAILTGTERLVNGKLRLSIRLTNASTGEALLSRFLEVVPGASVPSEAVHAVGRMIDSILNINDWSSIALASRDPGMQNPAAREFIVSGRELMFRQTVEAFDKSIACLERAIELEPGSAIAHAYLATAACSRVYFVSDNRFLKRAQVEAREAVRLDPSSADSHRALAGVAYQNGRIADALEEQFRAVEIAGPEERVAGFIGMTLDALGEPGRALGWYEMARHWQTRPGTNDSSIGKCWAELGDDRQAEIAYRRAADLRPEISQGWVGLCHLRLLQGKIDAARALCQENRNGFKDDNDSDQVAAQVEFFARNYSEAERLYRDLAKRDSEGGTRYDSEISYGSVLGRVRQLLGDAGGGRAILEQCRATELGALKEAPASPATLYRLAAIEASLGNGGIALGRLRAAVAAGWIDYRSPRLDPRFDALHDDPRFQTILNNLATTVAEMRRQTGQPIKMALSGENHSPQIGSNNE
jgi:tetratricopeptide (TPR) repeat protein/TolB-like protein/tRNA A-37 threonylcarbamoyl transferase component Bud32